MEKGNDINNGGNSPLSEQISHEGKADPRIKRAQRFFELASTIYGENKTVNDLINDVTPETAIEILRHLNAKLLKQGLARKSKIAYSSESSRMLISTEQANGQKEDIAPERNLQVKLFQDYLNAIKKISDKEKRAALAYFGLNCLHLFEDGNGRTSRAVYTLIMEDKLPSDIEDIFIHKTDDDDWNASGREKFVLKRGVRPVREAIAVANVMLQAKLVDLRFLDEKYHNTHFSIKSVLRSNWVEYYIPKETRKELSDKDLFEINVAFSDGTKGNSYSTLAGLTLAVVLQGRGTIDRITKENKGEDDSCIAFSVNYDQQSNDESKKKVRRIFQGWKAEDYKRVTSTYKLLKNLQNLAIISIFKDGICFEDNEKISDWLMGR